MFDFKTKCFILQLWLLLVSVAECQRPYCNEFLSPKKLVTSGSSVDLIRLPLRGNKYSRNQLCEWIIECKEGEVIQLEVQKCSIQDRDIHGECNQDYVNVFDVRQGESYFLDRFCGTDAGMVYQSTGTTLIVRFFSDNVYEYEGFFLSYAAKSAESSDGASHDLTVQLAVGIPVGILVIVMVVVFSVVMCRLYRKRRHNSATYLNNTSSSPGLAAHNWNESAANPSSFLGSAATVTSSGGNRTTGRGPPAWGSYRDQNYDASLAQGFPLQVTLPEDEEEYAAHAGGRSSPPPAYESLGFEEQQAMTPPAYDAVVKEAEDEHH
ncbi:inactive serine protease PAMR1 [Elysia marginata]|uniref:Inactive serine protease PAMR1 n=1 Tax=Elysia marginata TaxID=1093978 RepID=A0AAV4FQZ9_9GAST|nr:inactive serine protease PAMR1 [Elysia marginata]